MSKVKITPGVQGSHPRLRFLVTLPNGLTYGIVVVGEEDGTFDTAVIGAALDVLDREAAREVETDATT